MVSEEIMERATDTTEEDLLPFNVEHAEDGSIISTFMDGTQLHSLPNGSTIKLDASGEVSSMTPSKSIRIHRSGPFPLSPQTSGSEATSRISSSVFGNYRSLELDSTLKVFENGLKVQENQKGFWRFCLNRQNGAVVQLGRDGTVMKLNNDRWKKHMSPDGNVRIMNPSGELTERTTMEVSEVNKLFRKYSKVCSKLLETSGHKSSSSDQKNQRTIENLYAKLLQAEKQLKQEKQRNDEEFNFAYNNNDDDQFKLHGKSFEEFTSLENLSQNEIQERLISSWNLIAKIETQKQQIKYESSPNSYNTSPRKRTGLLSSVWRTKEKDTTSNQDLLTELQALRKENAELKTKLKNQISPMI